MAAAAPDSARAAFGTPWHPLQLSRGRLAVGRWRRGERPERGGEGPSRAVPGTLGSGTPRVPQRGRGRLGGARGGAGRRGGAPPRPRPTPRRPRGLRPSLSVSEPGWGRGGLAARCPRGRAGGLGGGGSGLARCEAAALSLSVPGGGAEVGRPRGAPRAAARPPLGPRARGCCRGPRCPGAQLRLGVALAREGAIRGSRRSQDAAVRERKKTATAK